MKKHHGIKAMVLVIVMLFHSLVLVPRSYATVFEGTLARVAFRSISPAAIMALGSNTALVLGVPLAVGVGYLVYKSDAITALKNWWNSTIDPINNPTEQQSFHISGQPTSHFHINKKSFSPLLYSAYAASGATCNGGFYDSMGRQLCNQMTIWWGGTYSTSGAALTALNADDGSNVPPRTPTDYAAQLASSQPDFNGSAAVYGSPGVAAALANGAVAVSTATMSDTEADNFIAGLGATPISDSGAQTLPAGVTPNDNTITSGDSASIGLLQQILNYVSNLLGIKTAVEAQRVSMDNVAGMTQAMKLSTDNVAAGTSVVATKLDNVVSGINSQTQALEGIETKVEHLDNTVTTSAATSGTVQTRIQSLRDLAATKFPFSLVTSISVSDVNGQSEYNFDPLPLTPSISVQIDPMGGPLGDLFIWVRQLLVWFLWAGTLFAMLKKVMEM